MFAVTVTDTEEMECGLVLQIWRKNEAVLVYLVWVVWCKSNTRGECKLLHNILRFDLFFFNLFVFNNCFRVI